MPENIRRSKEFRLNKKEPQDFNVIIIIMIVAFVLYVSYYSNSIYYGLYRSRYWGMKMKIYIYWEFTTHIHITWGKERCKTYSNSSYIFIIYKQLLFSFFLLWVYDENIVHFIHSSDT